MVIRGYEMRAPNSDADEADKSKSSSEVVTKEASTEIDKEKILIKKNNCSPGRWIELVETPSAPSPKTTIKRGPKRTTLRLSFDSFTGSYFIIHSSCPTMVNTHKAVSRADTKV